MTVAILACAMVTLGTLFYVFYLPGKLQMGPDKTRLAYLQERKEAVYENLRDLNFEHQAGKLPDQDYQSLKASLEGEAAGILAEMAGIEQAAASAIRDQKRSESLKLSPRVTSVCPVFFAGAHRQHFRVGGNSYRHAQEWNLRQAGGRR